MIIDVIPIIMYARVHKTWSLNNLICLFQYSDITKNINYQATRCIPVWSFPYVHWSSNFRFIFDLNNHQSLFYLCVDRFHNRINCYSYISVQFYHQVTEEQTRRQRILKTFPECNFPLVPSWIEFLFFCCCFQVLVICHIFKGFNIFLLHNRILFSR